MILLMSDSLLMFIYYLNAVNNGEPIRDMLVYFYEMQVSIVLLLQSKPNNTNNNRKRLIDCCATLCYLWLRGTLILS